MELQCRNLFIDTQYFLDKSFNFENNELKSLCQLIKDGLIKVYLTDITNREIKKKINDELKLALNKISVSDTRMLKAIPAFRKFIESYNEEKANNFFLSAFEKFKKDCKITIISSDEIKPINIFEQYCQEITPFKSTQGKNRKNEFPDAFALAAIEQWSDKYNEKSYLLSGDSDWEQFASETTKWMPFDFEEQRFFYIKELSFLLDLIIRHETDLADLTAFADKLMETHKKDIQEFVKYELGNILFYGHATEIDVTIVKDYLINIKIKNMDIIAVNRNGASYNIDFELDYILKYRVADYENSRWDAVAKDYVSVQRFTTYQYHKFERSFGLDISFKDGIAGNFTILKSYIPEPLDVDYDLGEFVNIDIWTTKLPVIIVGVDDGRITENGDGSQEFEDFESAKMIFPELNIYKASERFTNAQGNRINEQLRFETWIVERLFSS